MSEELRLDGLGVDPEVLATIVALAAEKVDGVVCVDRGGLPAFRRKRPQAKGIAVGAAEDGSGLEVSVHLTLKHGRPLRTAAGEVQEAVAEALESQVGQPVAAVDVFIDNIVFGE